MVRLQRMEFMGGEKLMAKEILTDLVNELGENFIEYAVAVNTDRAIPDATNGLKPVAKRLIYCAYDNGYFSKKIYRCYIPLARLRTGLST